MTKCSFSSIVRNYSFKRDKKKKEERKEKKRDSRDFIQQIFIQPITNEFEAKVIELYINIYIHEIFRKLSRRVAIKRVGRAGNFSFEKEDGGTGEGEVETLKEAAQRCNIEPCRSISQEGFHIRMAGARILDLYLRKVEDSYKGRGGGGEGEGMIPIETLIIIIIIIPFSFHRCLFDAAFSSGP